MRSQEPPLKSPGGVKGSKPPSRPTVDEEDDFDDDIGEGGMGDDFGDVGTDAGFFDDPAEMFGSDPAYNSAIQKAQFVHVKYIKHLTTHIDASTLFPDTKDTLKMIVRGLFDPTEVYAKTKNLALEEIETEIVLAQARFGFHPSDVDNPSLSNILNMLWKLYRRFISRSENGWERELDNRNEMHSTSTQRIIDDRFKQPAGNPKSQYPIYSPRRWL